MENLKHDDEHERIEAVRGLDDGAGHDHDGGCGNRNCEEVQSSEPVQANHRDKAGPQMDAGQEQGLEIELSVLHDSCADNVHLAAIQQNIGRENDGHFGQDHDVKQSILEEGALTLVLHVSRHVLLDL